MKIDRYLSELLFDHDCVIVPELGGFVTNYMPAKIHPTQHSFSPPYKGVLFNANLRNNDGLLANYISLQESTNYIDATKKISAFVQFCNEELSNGNKVIIEKVGALSFNVERNIQFEPDNSINYLKDSFGLSIFQSPAIKRDGHIPKIEKQFKDRTTVLVEKERKKISLGRVLALALLMPLWGAAIWVSLKTEWYKNVNYSSFNFFEKKNEQPIILNKTPEKKSTTITKIASEPQQVVAVVEDTLSTKINAETTSLVSTASLDTNEAEPDKTQVVNSNPPYNGKRQFHIVSGCFKILENAQRFVEELKNKNLSAEIIGETAGGLHIVSVGDYVTKQEAQMEMAQVKQVAPDVWLLEK